RLLMPRLRLVPMTLLRGQLAEHLYGVRPEGDLPELDQKIPALLEHARPTGVVAVPALQGTEVGQGKRDGSGGAHLAAQLDRGVEVVASRVDVPHGESDVPEVGQTKGLFMAVADSAGKLDRLGARVVGPGRVSLAVGELG